MESIRGLLGTLFETVIMVSDEKSLIETLDRFDPDFVVVDLSIPVARDQNVAALLNRYDPKLKYIVLSNHDEPEVIKNCQVFGASGFILKRSSARELIKAVEAVQNGGTYFSLGSDASK